MPAPYPTPTNFTGIASIFTYMNTLGNGWTVTLFAIAMHVIMFAYMTRKKNDALTSFMTSTYVMLIPVGLLFAMGSVSTSVALSYALLFGLSVLVYIGRK